MEGNFNHLEDTSNHPDGNFNQETELPENQNEKIKINEQNIFRAKITESIGHGEDAKNSLIYLTIKYAFISGIVFTVLIAINHGFDKYCSTDVKNENFVEAVTQGWQLLIPIITLSLGYAFGKSQK